MNRILAFFSTGLLAAAAVAQCNQPPSGTSVTPGLVGWSVNYTTAYPLDDESITSPPIAFTAFPSFPMAGAAGTLNQFWVNSNGDIYLTDSALALTNVVTGASFGISSLSELRGGGVSGSARIAVLGHDQQGSIAVGAAWDISVDQSVPGEVRVCWKDMRRFNNATGDRYSFSCTLFSSGAVRMDYGTIPAPTVSRIVGVSRGANVGTTTSPNQDLSAGVDSGTVGLIYELFGSTRPFDLGDKSVLIVPNGLGGYTTAITCNLPPASHTAYNAGCYTYNGPATECFYEYFANPAATSAQLPGTSITMTPTGTGYAVTNGGGAYVAPSGGATTLVLTDDSETNVTPSIAFPFLSGPIATMTVCSNGYINMAAAPSGNSTTAYGDQAALYNAVVGTFRSNGDYDPGASPGQIKWEEIANILFVTWENVERYQINGTSDRFQCQMNLLSGVVVWVWDAMAASGAGTAIDTVVGYAPGGGSFNPGSIDLATALPIVTTPDVQLLPLTLSAAPAPTFVPLGSSVPITYTTTNLRDLSPAVPGAYFASLAFSINVPPPSPGIDLTLLGLDAPGCLLNISTVDVFYPISPVANTHNEVIVVPQPLVSGDTFYVQAVNFIIPNSLPTGLNNFGILTSNGIRSYFETF